MSIDSALYWLIADLIGQVKHHGWHSDYEIIGIAEELARTGRVRTIGRRCEGSGEPRDQWEPIPVHEWVDLYIDGRRRRPPHYSNDVFWRSTGQRAWAFVQFSKEDLLREWLADVFSRPRIEPVGDIVIPPGPKHTNNSRPPRNAPVFSGARDPAKLYLDRLEKFKAEHGCYPSQPEDEKWCKDEKLRQLDDNKWLSTRATARALRNAHLPEEVKRGGRGQNLAREA
jgi:hypothetical protein